jgi:hypothetical protein
MNKIYKSIITVGSVFISLYAFIIYAFLELGVAVHPIMKANFKLHSIGIYFHIFPSLIALLLGPFQFNEKFRTTKTHLHRFIGKVYLLCVLIGGFQVYTWLNFLLEEQFHI